MVTKNFIRLISLCVSVKPYSLNTGRLYGRWINRKPTKVYLPYEDLPKTNLKSEKIIDLEAVKGTNNLTKKSLVNIQTDASKEFGKDNRDSTNIRKKKDKDLEDRVLKESSLLKDKPVFDENNDIIYEKLGDNDGRINNIIIGCKSKKHRSKYDHTLVEGWRLIADGLEAKSSLKYIIFSRLEDLHKIRPFLPKSGVKIFKIPYKEIKLWSDLETSPGILGIFKTPTPENVKLLYEPLPLQLICDNIRTPGNLGAILRAAVGVGCKRILLTKGCVDLWEPKVIRSASGAHFRLPIHSSLEWDKIRNMVDDENSVFVADNNTSDSILDDINSKYCLRELPVLPYYSVEYSTLKAITLIIGGETEGISEESFRFASERNGLRLNIPLQRGVDSLNTGMATAVISFEIKKQIQQALAKLDLQLSTKSNKC